MRSTFYMVFGLLLFNCGGIPKYKDADHKVLTHVKAIEGEYQNFDSDSLKLNHNSIHGKINWKKRSIDTTKYTSVQIRVLNKKQLRFDFIKDSTLLKSQVLKYRLRHNGFVKLRNKNLRISGIPYVFGEYALVKYELGLTKANDLILHGCHEEGGGMLIVLSGGGRYVVKRIYESI